MDFTKQPLMSTSDALRQLLIDFFNLPSDVKPEDLTQKKIPAWDSLASVQLIAELQGAFDIDFDLEEIESLRSYDNISTALRKKGISVDPLESKPSV
jgi:acyl carrier protein